ncbi:PTS glucose transporter subunit IIA [Bacillus pseudomycoides]|uniref:PTS glucose transporter subunit IIA n=1 Tax=Bacillus pseudomycoides TaxID=64104 RepID=A0A1Y3MNQ0_9BACI|nr:PTS glucose transporter subunit IIA [Bacillus pseudomycoides]PDY47514.1 PTS glucose transporter subunit IIA [Bacillus pseudomycoides]PEA84587.1 PTS glucose transporter subunit IIA [Bacillus pseudomycoides]PED06773.1 PTS glucose transporter subunit IIA [Bacillus pseudomycoides]PED72274.1 PTS glucose transporter subunit IIA [Bacillus pseudomycoides]
MKFFTFFSKLYSESFTLFLYIIPYFLTNDKFSNQFVSQK